jgi:hypothetical protein
LARVAGVVGVVGVVVFLAVGDTGVGCPAGAMAMIAMLIERAKEERRVCLCCHLHTTGMVMDQTL